MKELTKTYFLSIRKPNVLLSLIMCSYMMSYAQPSYYSNTVFTGGGTETSKPADINQDGIIDILLANGNLYWLENDGNENFTTHLVDNTSGNASNATFADLNNDGAMDIVATFASNGNQVAWYENDGNENFTKHIINSNVKFAFGLFAIDLDGNGTMDVIASGINETGFDWYDNDGSGNFIKKAVSTTVKGVNSIHAADLDNDGDNDLVITNSSFDDVFWFKNDGMENFTKMSLFSFSYNYTQDIYVDDVNGDGFLDIMMTSFLNNKLAWYRNNGNGTFTGFILSSNYWSPHSIYTLDWEGDGDIDFITTSLTNDRVITIWENDGNESFTRNNIVNNFPGKDARPIDIDGDGDTDIIGGKAGGVILFKACSSDTDGDMDGFVSDCDCNDGNADIFPGAPESCNGEDNNCNGIIDEQDPNFVDIIAPSEVLCNNPAVELDQDGQYIFTGSEVFLSGTDACSTVSFSSANPASVDCYDVGTVQVIVTAQDEAGNTATCTASVTVEDNILPQITCNDITVVLNDAGFFQLSLFEIFESGVDNCGEGWSLTASPNKMTCAHLGVTPVTLTAKSTVSGSNQTGNCIAMVTVLDEMDPYALCHDITVELDANGQATITPEDVDGIWESGSFFNSFDNCSVSLSIDVNSFDCSNLGLNPVTLTVTDPSGNAPTCVANVTVTEGASLPNGWESNDIGQTGMGNDYSYGPCGQVPEFTVSGGGNNATSTTTDNVAFTSTQLCGDGSITAKIESVSASGYGGLMIRETTDAGSKQVSVFSNMTNILRHETRYFANANKVVQSFFKPNPVWLQLQRQGDWIFSYYSFDGNNFQYIHAVYVPMQSCVEVGLASFSYLPNVQAEVVFSNVSVSGNNGGFSQNNDNISTPQNHTAGIPQNHNIITPNNLNLFPNPNQGQFSLQMNEPIKEAGTLTIYNHYGQQVYQQLVDAGSSQIELDLGQIPSGMYLLELRGEAAQPIVKRFTVSQ